MIASLEAAEDVTKYPLKINFRNTFEINNLLQKLIKNFYPDSKLFYDKPLENHGEKPQLIEVNDRNDQIIKVTELINSFSIAKTLETTEVDIINTIFAHPTLSEAMHESVLSAYNKAIHF